MIHQRRSHFLSLLVLASSLVGCSYPQVLAEPYDPGGRSINSAYTESHPHSAGRYVTFVSDRGLSQDIYLYDRVDRQLIDLPGLNSLDTIASHPDVSADGRYIVFAGNRQGKTDIYLYDRSLRQTRNLTGSLNTQVQNPVLNADGSRIAFEANAKGQWDIFVYNRLGERVNR
ncbi:TolB family protein [Roseofilum casamattae]|uniref:Tol biopolymer transporter periplasmic protein n=1 Tax=Roseofilum casamattae BLCC-M143 TaxID=3022442 RepID=A0ABT7BY56_9CYAN|nr:hypothetical protein [Roseofilum casamattae]MDJ1184134.1 Tol biopolymer transporter periplasmic protein [Roseofilum casamattae BLCC-M143]